MKTLTYLILGMVLFSSPFIVTTRAQQAVTSAILTGRVEDASGAVVSGASITALNLATNQRQTATTDRDGRYRFPYLQVGSYNLLVEAPGFNAQAKLLTVTVGQ